MPPPVQLRTKNATATTARVVPSPATWLFSLLLPALLLAIYAHLQAHKIFFVASDLGRHLKTGELIVRDFHREVLTTNFYSYTASNFPAANHHWASGVVFYVLWKTVGFTWLHGLFVALRLTVLGLFFDLARRRAGLALASLVGTLVVFIAAERTEIRPEIFSYAFCAVFFWLLTRVRAGEISLRWLWWLPLLEIAWVNLHIYFFLGPAILGAFFLDALLCRDARWRIFGAVLVTMLVVTIVNPFGVYGALAPMTIFQNYGLDTAENQSVLFMVRRVGGLTYVLFLIVAPLLALSFVAVAWKDRRRIAWSDVFIGAIVTAMGCVAIRNLTLFALFALPLLAGNLHQLIGRRGPVFERRLRIVALTGLLGLGVFVTTQDLKALKFWNAGEPGLGVESGNQAAAEFFRANHIRGPVFNNFDIGGYLIFHLWPEVHVFVDNRPEAYPAAHFRDVYWPMLKDRAAWARRASEFGFNAIFFTHTDMSPAAQQFLIDRMDDPDWALVFCDASNVIYVRRNEANASLIRQFAQQR